MRCLMPDQTRRHAEGSPPARIARSALVLSSQSELCARRQSASAREMWHPSSSRDQIEHVDALPIVIVPRLRTVVAIASSAEPSSLCRGTCTHSCVLRSRRSPRRIRRPVSRHESRRTTPGHPSRLPDASPLRKSAGGSSGRCYMRAVRRGRAACQVARIKYVPTSKESALSQENSDELIGAVKATTIAATPRLACAAESRIDLGDQTCDAADAPPVRGRTIMRMR